MSLEHGSKDHVSRSFELLVDTLEEYAIFMLDADGVVAAWNSGARRMHGYEDLEIVGQHVSRFYLAVDVAAAKPESELAQAASTGDHRTDGWRVRKDGSTFWAHVVITAIYDGEQRLAGFAEVVRDETERRIVAAATRRTTEQGLRVNAATDEFLSRMSHELRTPLNAILGFGQVLDMDDLNPAQRDCVDRIVSAGDHLLDLVDEVLDISSLRHSAMRLSLESVHVPTAVAEAVYLVRPLTDLRRVRVVVDAMANDPSVRADRRRLQQVLLNLLENAVKHNPDDGEVRIECESDQSRVRLTVTDTGPGLAESDLSKLFQPFERLSAAHRHVEGVGLGLALTKRLVEAMDGRVGVNSQIGVGSSFWIELPTDRPDEGDDGELAASSVLSGPSRLPRRVLYVEDNESNVRLLERVMARHPLALLTVATTGGAALERVFDDRPDVIFLDLHLPDVSGEHVLACLRTDPRTARTPVVVLSADATADRRDRLLALGANAYLTKPFDIDELLDIIDDPPVEDRTAPPPGILTAASMTGADADLGSSTAAVAHSLNNLLGVIMNLCVLLNRSVTDPTATADLAEIRNATEQAVDLVKQLRPGSQD